MTPGKVALDDTRRELIELIAAIDRRLPQVARADEAAIVRVAQLLRAEALKRIGEIERDIADQASRDTQSAIVC